MIVSTRTQGSLINSCLLGVLDLSAAFDTIDYEILLSRLEQTFCIEDDALNWLKSYLTDRYQVVKIAGRCSGRIKLAYGVPQGSVLGPLLFVLYTYPINQYCRLLVIMACTAIVMPTTHNCISVVLQTNSPNLQMYSRIV